MSICIPWYKPPNDKYHLEDNKIINSITKRILLNCNILTELIIQDDIPYDFRKAAWNQLLELYPSDENLKEIIDSNKYFWYDAFEELIKRKKKEQQVKVIYIFKWEKGIFRGC